MTPEQRARKYEANRRWNERNREYYSERSKRVRQSPEFRERVNACYRTWYQQSDNRVLKNMRKRLWDALRGTRKTCSTQDLVGCSVEVLQEHLAKQFTDGMTWENYGLWHVDHVRPCADFDLSNPAQQRQCFHYTNLQPLWAVDNARKGSRCALSTRLYDDAL